MTRRRRGATVMANWSELNRYFGELEDDELEKLVHYLDILKNVENVRKVEKRNWRNRV